MADNFGTTILVWVENINVTMMSIICPLSRSDLLGLSITYPSDNQSTGAGGAHSTYLSREYKTGLDILIVVNTYNQYSVADEMAHQV